MDRIPCKDSYTFSILSIFAQNPDFAYIQINDWHFIGFLFISINNLAKICNLNLTIWFLVLSLFLCGFVDVTVTVYITSSKVEWYAFKTIRFVNFSWLML